MIILDTTSKSLEIILPGAVTTNQLPWTVAYVTVGATPPLIEGDGVTNNGSAVTIVPAPGANQQQIVKGISVNNADTVNQKITVRINNGGTFRNVFVATMAVGDNFVYDAEGGFHLFDQNGNVKQGAMTLPLAVSSGGTGDTTLTAHGVLVGEGTSPIAATAAGTTGQPLLSGGASADPSYGTLGVAAGGTGAVTLTTHGVLVGEGTSTVVATAVGAANQVLAGVASSDPTFQNITSIVPTGGTTSTSTGSPDAAQRMYSLTNMTVGVTMSNPTGSPVNGQSLIFRFRDNGSPQGIGWGSAYNSTTVAMPSTTLGSSATLTVGFIYNTDNSLNRWQCMAVV